MDNEKKDWHTSAGNRFAKGNPGKPVGSSKNKMRDKVRTFIETEWENFPTWFNNLKPEKRISIFLELLPYTVARLQSVAMVDSEGNDLPSTRIDYSKLSEPLLKELLQNTTVE